MWKNFKKQVYEHAYEKADKGQARIVGGSSNQVGQVANKGRTRQRPSPGFMKELSSHSEGDEQERARVLKQGLATNTILSFFCIL